MRFDQSEVLSPAILIGAATLSADNTPGAVNLDGYQSALIEIAVGAGGITFSATDKIEFKLTHSDDNITYTAVDVADVVGLASVDTGGIVLSLTAAHAAATVTAFGYVGGKQYLKLLADFSGTHGTGTPISATAIRGMPLSVAPA